VLTKYDEFLCHQIETTFDHVNASAREWTERVILHHHDTKGKYQLSLGFGLYPNRNVIDAFGLLTLDEKTQYNVRASRELRPQPDEVRVGPFSYDIVEPLKKLRSRLDDNQYGLSYDVEFEAVMPPSAEDPQFARYKGRVVENIERYVQAGRGNGWIKVEGNIIKLDRKTCFVERDHSWGIRRTGAGGETLVEPAEIPIGFVHSWAVMQFEKWGACYIIRELWDGTQILSSGAIFYPYGSGKEESRLVRIEHDFKFRPHIRKITSGTVTLIAADGARTEVSVKPLNYVCLKPGGYLPYNGWAHGQWMGSGWMEGFKLNLTDKKILEEASWLDTTSCELRCDNEIGYGVIEVVIAGKYPKYGFEGY
jgi:hypothetical protein